MGNIIVHIHAATTGQPAFLISGHYDSVYLSPGAMDNAAGISSMLELIEVMANDAPAQNEVIVAFVNGEEYGLLGSIDFSTFDADFASVMAFVNIDGTPGSKQLNFRSTGGKMDELYAAVPRPLAFVIANDIFSSGIVSSETDFVVYAPYLNGLDFATFNHRQTYHTMNDRHVKDGVLQFQGENMLALARKIASLDAVSTYTLTTDITQHVYFSFLNHGYVVYTLNSSYIMCVMLIVGYILIYGVLMLHRYLYWKDMGMGPSANPLWCLLIGYSWIVITFIAAFVIPAIIGFIAAGLAPYYSYTSPGLAIFTFLPITMGVIYLFQWIFQRLEKRFMESNLEVNRQRLLWGTGLGWWFMLAIFTPAAKWSGSVYIIFMFAAFHLLAVIVHHICWFFGLLTEKPYVDMFEIMELAEQKEEQEDKDEFDTTGQVTQRPARAVEHDRWRATYSKPDLVHFAVYFIATFPPMLFFLDPMVPFIQMGTGDISVGFMAVVIILVVFLFNLHFLPLSRRSHHYGIIATVLFIASIILFIFLIIGGASTFTPAAPYKVRPSQVGSTLSLTPVLNFSPSLKLYAQLLSPSSTWTCNGNTNCSAPGFAAPPVPSSVPIAPPHGFPYAARINSTNAWIHSITFPTGTSYAFLNGIYTGVDPANPVVDFLLASLQATSQWTIEYNGPLGLITVESFFDDAAYMPSLPALLQNQPEWATFKGRGSGLASQRYSVLCQFL